MKFSLLSVLILTLSLGMFGCSTTSQPNASSSPSKTTLTPEAKYITAMTAAPDTEHLTLAKRFLHSFDAGSLAIFAFKNELERQSADKPGAAELTGRALASITADDYENLMARVYVRHLNEAELAEIVQFVETETGSKYMRLTNEQAMAGKKATPDIYLKAFSADELVTLMKALESNVFTTFSKKIDTINKDMETEGGKLGIAVVKEYIRKQ